MQISKKYGIAKFSYHEYYVHLYDLETGICLFINRILSDTVFVTSELESTEAILGVSRRGLVLSISIDENKLNLLHHVIIKQH